MNLDQLHAAAAANLAGCDNPRSIRSILLREVVATAEAVVMPLERQRIDIMAQRIPTDVMAAIKARREEQP